MITIDGEATRDPIFVLLKITWHCTECSSIKIEDIEDAPCSCHSSRCPLMFPCTRYRTEDLHSVFLTREEAESFGESQRHNLGEKGDGWTVWCIPAEGELARILNTVRMVR